MYEAPCYIVLRRDKDGTTWRVTKKFPSMAHDQEEVYQFAKRHATNLGQRAVVLFADDGAIWQSWRFDAQGVEW